MAEATLYRCRAGEKTRLTERGCANNAARRRSAVHDGDLIVAMLLEACDGCPGVLALAAEAGADPPLVFSRARPTRAAGLPIARPTRAAGLPIARRLAPLPDRVGQLREGPVRLKPRFRPGGDAITLRQFAAETGRTYGTLKTLLKRRRANGGSEVTPLNPGGKPLYFARETILAAFPPRFQDPNGIGTAPEAEAEPEREVA